MSVYIESDEGEAPGDTSCRRDTTSVLQRPHNSDLFTIH